MAEQQIKPRLWHIYYGTRGTAGAYLDDLQRACLVAGCRSSAFASARYRFGTDRVHRFFFPLTEWTERRNRPIQALRYLELLAGYGLLAILALFTRPIVNLSLIDDTRLTYWFFRGLKGLGLKVCVTCHDVLSHHRGLTARRTRIYRSADRLIVHSTYAHGILSGLVGEAGRGKIRQFPFPSAPVQKILRPDRLRRAKQNLARLIPDKRPYFLFIGIVRESKGIASLLSAWDQGRAKEKSRLVIAGKWAGPAIRFQERARGLAGCLVIDRYLGDEEFISLIEESRFVVLPYLEYSHSAVLFACGWARAAVIISNAGLFSDILPAYELSFPAGQADELARVLERAAGMTGAQVSACRDILASRVRQAEASLAGEVAPAFCEV
jgi:glycosyltransferase involved in cell wall biosynthesis